MSSHSNVAPASALHASTLPKTSKRTWTQCLFFSCCVVPVVLVLAATGLLVGVQYSKLQPGQMFSLVQNQTIVPYPANSYSRYRGEDYLDRDRYFFQWWNFLVYDSETNDHFTLVYNTNHYSKTAQSVKGIKSHASVSLVHKQLSQDVDGSTESFPLSHLYFEPEHSWGMRLKSKKPQISPNDVYTIELIDDSNYRITGFVDGAYSVSGKNISWDIIFTRVHGSYSGVDNEDSNRGDACFIVSTLFAHHSIATGYVQEGEKKYVFSKDQPNRYRAYAAGSWGCRLPSGYPTLQYYWTWLWLTIPATATTPEIGMIMGSVRYQTNSSLIGDMYGGGASVGLGHEMITATMAKFHHASTFEIPLTATSNDQFLRNYSIGFDQWAEASDKYGSYKLPLIQSYVVHTKNYKFELTFHSKPEQYFRCPVIVEHIPTDPKVPQPVDDTLQVFSDFRAVGVHTKVQIWKKQEDGSADQVIYDGWSDTSNALEYAYEADMDVDAYAKSLGMYDL